nr:hypothetical protein [Tanacetum cinerariifolium]
MATTLDQQVALDEALVPSTQTLRIRRSNLRLPSDIQSKEPTLQVVYDVLRNSPFLKAFLVTADVPEIYMQEFWATAKLHQHSIRFKIDTRKHVLDLEPFREMLHISPRIPGQSFDELPFEEEILEFLRFLGHSTQIKTLTDVNGLYHESNVDYAYLIWEDFVYQVEHKSQKKSNEMYYPRFTKVIIDYFMTRKPSIPRRNRVNWHYVRDDVLFTTIKNSKAYKEYYACATGEAAPKPKASARKKTGGFASSTTPPTPISTPTPTTIVGREESEGDKTDESDDDNDDDDDKEETTKIGKQEVKESDEGDDEATKSNKESAADDQPITEASQHPEWFQQQKKPLTSDRAWNKLCQLLTEAFNPFLMNRLKVDTLTPELLAGPTYELMKGSCKTQAENEEFLKNLDENIQKIIKEQVKEQVKVQVSKILPKIEKTVNEKLEAEVLTRSSNSSKTSYAVAADLSELELKKILIENIESNKSIHRSDEQRNLYKALVKAYESDKIILDTYGDTVTLKRHRDDTYKDEEPSARSDRGSKRRREGKEPESTSAPKEKATKTIGKSTQGTKSHQKTASESTPPEEPMQTTQDLEEP